MRARLDDRVVGRVARRELVLLAGDDEKLIGATDEEKASQHGQENEQANRNPDGHPNHHAQLVCIGLLDRPLDRHRMH